MSYCCNSSRLLPGLQKESKLWKERYLVEKRCRKVLEEWTLHTFGFDVKLDYEKPNNIARIQAIENKVAMRNATFPNESAEGEMKVVVVEVSMKIEDIYNEEDSIPISLELEDQISRNQNQTRIEVPSEAPQIINISGTAVSGYPVVSPSESPHQQLQQFQHHQGGASIEIAAPGEVSGAEQVVYIGNYEDGAIAGGGVQPSYYILKSDDNEEIPVQFDYSTFINGDVGSADKIYYRIATPNETVNAMNISATGVEPESSTVTVPSASPKQATKRKLPVPATKNVNVGSKAAKAKKPAQSKTTTKAKKYNVIIDPDPAVYNAASVITNPKKIKETPTKSSDEKQQTSSRSPLEFGLTLREKAEIYVRTKAKDAIRKVGGGYECTFCLNGNYAYSTVENAVTHTKTHFESKPYRCEFPKCEETFTIQKELLQHRKGHAKTKESKSPMKPSVMYSQQNAAQIPLKTVVVRPPVVTAPVVTPAPIAKPVTPVAVVPKPLKPTPKDTKKQFKCQVGGCLWSYATAEELGWHMKAHSQARV